MTIWAIVPAAGVGRRFGAATPKQYLPLLDRSVLEYSLEALLSQANIKRIFVALSPEDGVWQSLECSRNPRVESVLGGGERQDSVCNALKAISERGSRDDWVLVHDAVRPCVKSEDIARLIEAVRKDEVGGLLVSAMDNTVKRQCADSSQRVGETVDRAELWNALTPQMFRVGLLLDALESAADEGASITDESSALERRGYSPLLVPSSKTNIKITHPSDLIIAEAILKRDL